MNEVWATIGSILLSLTVTFLFNYFIGLPKKLRSEKEQEKKIINNLILRVDKLESIVDNLPKYREQSLKIQEELIFHKNGIPQRMSFLLYRQL